VPPRKVSRPQCGNGRGIGSGIQLCSLPTSAAQRVPPPRAANAAVRRLISDQERFVPDSPPQEPVHEFLISVTPLRKLSHIGHANL